MDSPVAEDMHPAAEIPEAPAENLAAAAMPAEAEALQPAAATLGEALRPAEPEVLRPGARAVEQPSDFRRPRRMRRSAHWPLRIVDKRRCSSRASLRLRLRIQITD